MSVLRWALRCRRSLSSSVAVGKEPGALASTGAHNETSPVASLQESMRKLLVEPEALVVTREMEWGNILVGFEQANKYTIRAAPSGEVVGHIAEEDSIGKSLTRNLLKTHRSFKATVFDPAMKPLLHIFRPMYLISTALHVEEALPSGNQLGEVQMHWHMWRRRYDLFDADKAQFARIDGGFLALDFDLKDESDRPVAAINRDFTGFARELFTDAGQYVIHLKSVPQGTLAQHAQVGSSTPSPSESTSQDLASFQDKTTPMTLAQRAVCLGTAISVDFDYFSRHSRAGGGFMSPFFLPHGGGGVSDENPVTGAETDVGEGGAAAGHATMNSSPAEDAGQSPSPFESTSSANDQTSDSGFEEYDHGFEAPPDEPSFGATDDGEEGGSAMGTLWSIIRNVAGDGE